MGRRQPAARQSDVVPGTDRRRERGRGRRRDCDWRDADPRDRSLLRAVRGRDPGDRRRVLARRRVSSPRRPHRARKRFGQHFLSAKWAAKVLQAINPQPGDVFLEVGPGQGALTFPLAATGAPVIAVEVDRDLVDELATRVPPNVTLVAGDILKTDVMSFLTGMQPVRPPGVAPDASSPPRRYRLVGNLPYNLSTPILFKLIEWHQQHGLFADAVIMLQLEVAERLAAKPGTKAWGALSLYLKLHADSTILLRLPPGAFSPPPKVNSAIARLTFHAPSVKIADEKVFDQLVQRMFSLRRKTLHNVLKSIDKQAPAVLAQAGIDPQRRPETLTLPEIGRIVELLAASKRPAVL
ncbi:MAG: ribosomal RNA small subunit methyltransferase A [Acidobacteria bacterium]|nr:MAG: ribosomal RNA small subunit methyltransferase A [Acidobacteriota bacterium]